MKKGIAATLLCLITALSIAQTKSKIEWRGLYVGAQTLTPIDRFKLSSSFYAIGIVGWKSLNLNAQFIFPVPYQTPLIKVGFDVRVDNLFKKSK